MKKAIVLILFGTLLTINNIANAQIQNTDVMFFQSTNGGTVLVCKLDGSKLWCQPSYSISNFNSAQTAERWYNWPTGFSLFVGDNSYYYDSEMSTSERIVYEHSRTRKKGVYGNHFYLAFSDDLSSVIRFTLNHSSRGDSVSDKVYYVRVSLDDLLPKPVEINSDILDFLNE